MHTLSLWVVLLMTLSARAQWPSDPSTNLVLGALAGEQTTPLVRATQAGGAWVLWYDTASGNYDVRLQLLDAEGLPQFAANGLLVSDHAMTSFITEWDLGVDGEDHAIVVTNDVRDGEDWEIYAYRISPAGDFVWGANGIRLSDNDGSDVGQRILATVGGDIVIAWQQDTASNGSAVVLHRLSPAGEDVWEPASRVLTSTFGLSIPRMAATSDDGFLLSVVDVQGSSFSSPRHLYLRRFDAAGNELWTPGGTPLNTVGGIGFQMRPDVLNDGSDGAVCWWYDSHLSNQLHTWVQRVDAAGQIRWAANGVMVGNPAELQTSPVLALDMASQDVIVAWQSANLGQTQVGMGAQRLDSTATPLWGANGLSLAPLGGPQQFRLGLHALADGSSLLAWQEYDAGSAINSSIKGLGLSAEGTPLFAGPVDLTTTVSQKGYLSTALISAGSLLAVWADQRSGPSDVYLQNLNPDGSLGPTGVLPEPTLQVLSPASGDTLRLQPARIELAVENFVLSETEGDGLVRGFVTGPDGMSTFSTAETSLAVDLDTPGDYSITFLLVDHALQPIDPMVSADLVFHWFPPQLSIVDPQPDQELDELPIAVSFLLSGFELGDGLGHLAVHLNGEPLADHSSLDPLLLDVALSGSNTVELALRDAQGNPLDPAVEASVSFFYTGTGIDRALPGDFELSDAAPNPFNPSTSFSLRLGQSEFLRMSVYDLRGRRVAVLLDGQVAPGEHRVSWSAPSAPSGLYIVRLERLTAGGTLRDAMSRKVIRLN